MQHVIVVPWVSRVYGIFTLSVVLCTPEGEARGGTYNYTKGTNPYTLETHGTADLYYDGRNWQGLPSYSILPYM